MMGVKFIEYHDYLQFICARLKNDGFNLEEIRINEYKIDLFGISQEYDTGLAPYADGIDPLVGRGSYRLVFGIISTPAVTVDAIENYSKTLYDYAFKKVSESRQVHRIIFPVIASKKSSDEVITFVRSYHGIRIRFPIGDVTRPVLVDLDSDSINYNSKVTWKYYRGKKIAKEAIEKYLLLDNLKKM